MRFFIFLIVFKIFIYYCVLNTNNLLVKYVFSDGKIIDDVLKQRLENKVYTWFQEMKIMVALKPQVILEKDPAASPSQCIC